MQIFHNIRDEVYPVFFNNETKRHRKIIKLEWIESVIANPIKQEIQADGRIKLWAVIPEMENKYLRVILLPDGETVHNAFLDRSFKP